MQKVTVLNAQSKYSESLKPNKFYQEKILQN